MSDVRRALEARHRSVEGQGERLTLTVAEAAAMLGVSPSAAYDYVRMGLVPSIRLGGRILVPRRALLELIDGPVA